MHICVCMYVRKNSLTEKYDNLEINLYIGAFLAVLWSAVTVPSGSLWLGFFFLSHELLSLKHFMLIINCKVKMH